MRSFVISAKLPGKTSLGHLLGNGLQRPLFVKICMLARHPWATCSEMAYGGHFSHGFVRWRDTCWEIASRGHYSHRFVNWRNFFPGRKRKPCAPSVNHPASSPKYANQEVRDTKQEGRATKKLRDCQDVQIPGNARHHEVRDIKKYEIPEHARYLKLRDTKKYAIPACVRHQEV